MKAVPLSKKKEKSLCLLIVRSVDVPEERGYSKASVHNAMKRLEEFGYVKFYRGKITLTKSGLMDEPSASLDVNAEYELNNAIKTYAQDKAIIFISHRLSTTRLADCIYVFENGKIVEFGSHEALMACNGKYAEMYRLQASQYL